MPSDLEVIEYIYLTYRKAYAKEFKQELLERELKLGSSKLEVTGCKRILPSVVGLTAALTLTGVALLEKARGQKGQREAQARDLETREIEVFRNVHIVQRFLKISLEFL